MPDITRNRPLIFTTSRHSRTVLPDADACQRLLDIAARADVFEALRQGLDDAAHGRTRLAREVLSRLRSRLADLL